MSIVIGSRRRLPQTAIAINNAELVRKREKTLRRTIEELQVEIDEAG